LLIVNNYSISNGKSVANFSNGKSVAGLSTLDYPLLIVSIGISVALKSATDKSVAKKSATINLHPIFVVVDSVAKLFEQRILVLFATEWVVANYYIF
jgi:hypothetical protein